MLDMKHVLPHTTSHIADANNHCCCMPTKDVGSPWATRKEKKSYVSKWRNLIKTTALPQEPQSQKQAKVHAERQMGRKRETGRKRDRAGITWRKSEQMWVKERLSATKRENKRHLMFRCQSPKGKRHSVQNRNTSQLGRHVYQGRCPHRNLFQIRKLTSFWMP